MTWRKRILSCREIVLKTRLCSYIASQALQKYARRRRRGEPGISRVRMRKFYPNFE